MGAGGRPEVWRPPGSSGSPPPAPPGCCSSTGSAAHRGHLSRSPLRPGPRRGAAAPPGGGPRLPGQPVAGGPLPCPHGPGPRPPCPHRRGAGGDARPLRGVGGGPLRRGAVAPGPPGRRGWRPSSGRGSGRGRSPCRPSTTRTSSPCPGGVHPGLLDLADNPGLLAAAAAGAALGLAVLGHVDARCSAPALVLALLWGESTAWGLGWASPALAATVAALLAGARGRGPGGLVVVRTVLTTGASRSGWRLALGTRRRRGAWTPRGTGAWWAWRRVRARRLGPHGPGRGLGARGLDLALPRPTLPSGLPPRPHRVAGRVGPQRRSPGRSSWGCALAGVAAGDSPRGAGPDGVRPRCPRRSRRPGLQAGGPPAPPRRPLRGRSWPAPPPSCPRPAPGPPPSTTWGTYLDDWTSTDYALFVGARPSGARGPAGLYRSPALGPNQVPPASASPARPESSASAPAWSRRGPRAPGSRSSMAPARGTRGPRALPPRSAPSRPRREINLGPEGDRAELSPDLTLLPGRDPVLQVPDPAGDRIDHSPSRQRGWQCPPDVRGRTREVTLEVTFDSERDLRAARRRPRRAAPPWIVEVGEAGPGAPWRLP